jgi:mRNA-degrading endonuclease toxin of MazEF toxin-antitoxin module
MVSYAFGEIVLVAGGTYTSKPRPVLVFQKTGAYTGESVLVIPFTTTRNAEIETRIAITPTVRNGLDRDCFLEVDKLSAIKAAHIGGTVGVLEEKVIADVKVVVRELLML